MRAWPCRLAGVSPINCEGLSCSRNLGPHQVVILDGAELLLLQLMTQSHFGGWVPSVLEAVQVWGWALSPQVREPQLCKSS